MSSIELCIWYLQPLQNLPQNVQGLGWGYTSEGWLTLGSAPEKVTQMPRTCSPTSTAGAFPPQPAAPNLILPSSQLQIGTRSLGIDGDGTKAFAGSDAQQLTGGAQLERVGQNKDRSKLLESVMLDAPIYDSLQQLPEQTLRRRNTSEPLTQRHTFGSTCAPLA